MEAFHCLIRLIHGYIIGFALSYFNGVVFLMHLSVNSFLVYMEATECYLHLTLKIEFSIGL